MIVSTATYTLTEPICPLIQDYSLIKWIVFVPKNHSLDLNRLNDITYWNDILYTPSKGVLVHSIWEVENKSIAPVILEGQSASYKESNGQIRLALKLKAAYNNLASIYNLDGTDRSCYLIDINQNIYYYNTNSPIPTEFFGFNPIEVGLINPLLAGELHLKRNLNNKLVKSSYMAVDLFDVQSNLTDVAPTVSITNLIQVSSVSFSFKLNLLTVGTPEATEFKYNIDAYKDGDLRRSSGKAKSLIADSFVNGVFNEIFTFTLSPLSVPYEVRLYATFYQGTIETKTDIYILQMI